MDYSAKFCDILDLFQLRYLDTVRYTFPGITDISFITICIFFGPVHNAKLFKMFNFYIAQFSDIKFLHAKFLPTLCFERGFTLIFAIPKQ